MSDPDKMAEMMELAAEHDPERAREQLREQVEIAAWDVREGHAQPGDTYEAEESHLLTPDPLEEQSFVWELVYEEKDGTDVFEVYDPEGNLAGQVPVFKNADDQLNALGELAQEFHRDREIAKFQARFAEMEPGASHMLPGGKLVKRGPDTVAVYDPAYEVAVVTIPVDVTPELVKRIEDGYRAEMRAKYKDTELEGEF